MEKKANRLLEMIELERDAEMNSNSLLDNS